MNLGLSLLIVALLGAAIAVQVLYLRAIKRSGVEITGTMRIIVYGNVFLLSLIAVGTLVYGVSSQLNAAGGR